MARRPLRDPDQLRRVRASRCRTSHRKGTGRRVRGVRRGIPLHPAQRAGQERLATRCAAAQGQAAARPRHPARYGGDGVMETVTGEFHAYQVKFRAGREPLNWAELSTFMGLADQVQQRVLFTNCDALPAVINQRRGFYPIRGHDLDQLDERDFRVVRDWLQGTPQPRERKSPQEHQRQAVSEILAALRGEDRATALMACGTGKTLVALWVAEQLQPRTVLVLIPSLALLRQTLNEWLRGNALEPTLIFECLLRSHGPRRS